VLHERRRQHLEDRLAAGRRWHGDRFVFSSSIGTALDARNVIRRYQAIRERAGLPNVPWHHLRHFAATALLEAGEDLFVVSRILGHTSVATRAGFYGHVQPAMLRRSADRMDELSARSSG
jgi:integrase